MLGFALKESTLLPKFFIQSAIVLGVVFQALGIVLNATLKEIFDPVFKEPDYFNLARDGKALANKKIIMLDESDRNQHIAGALKSTSRSYFDYEVWETDHSFTNKRASLMNKVLWFLDK